MTAQLGLNMPIRLPAHAEKPGMMPAHQCAEVERWRKDHPAPDGPMSARFIHRAMFDELHQRLAAQRGDERERRHRRYNAFFRRFRAWECEGTP